MGDASLHWKLDILLARTARIEAILTQEGRHIMSAIDDLTAKVTAQGTVIGSAETLLKGLKDALDAAGTDPAKLAALSAQIDSQTTALAAAVVANTPATPAPPPATP